MDAPRLSVIIPCYDEERRLPATLARVRAYLDSRAESWEVLVVDDGSRDRTLSLAEAAAAEDARIQALSYATNRGKGYAVAFGALRARGEAVLFSDADLSTPIEELEKFMPRLEEGCDVVIGSRARPESELRVRQPWWRERLGRLMNVVIRAASGLDLPDTQCGFKLFSRRASRDIFSNLTVHGWMFDVEALVLARKLGYEVAEVPVVWMNSGDSRVRLSHTARTFWELFRIHTYWLRRQPERRRDESGVATQPAP